MTKTLALVTGGSSRIGLELALLLAKDGHDLVISGFSDRVQHAASELRSLGAEVIVFSSDLTTAEEDPALVARQGYHALLTGETCVIGGDEATREAARLNKVLPEEEKAHRHAMMARPH
ncbi:MULTISPECIES: SDR family NAD(P)-dependent oxidoreductase [Bradyrhizobium]|uniref:SDR family NAD(P)-dependent oxidoreductase n=1 Tax=Bradyrhizobium TaxID=374 RepID=UPI00155E1A4F|nr:MULTISPECIES: SDR family NAD(P)-dependent oxidoreductase [Bradyrhizobium]MDD1523590.1 hypothetical protein [Bradyrhizobium sp. WBAH30]MDD1547667.1 hypothetical protein [Bradyrhizobium sp. WBAH41]MDD1561319.1 hypothetical protein [Bradyrhizobium sp. WBAH23]MDD1568768.1 hypothetical protein [Bradyrhizobium sp. WBAH33]MDD1594529.1 hypothetical protein [Bradyrhizobium sp. WBAH42]